MTVAPVFNVHVLALSIGKTPGFTLLGKVVGGAWIEHATPGL
jgi:hypothetical protein